MKKFFGTFLYHTAMLMRFFFNMSFKDNINKGGCCSRTEKERQFIHKVFQRQVLEKRLGASLEMAGLR